MASLRSILFAGIAIAGVAACSQSGYTASQYSDGGQQIVGSGNVVQREMPVTDFRRLALNGPLNVEVRQGAEPGLVLIAEDNLIDLFEAEIEGDTLSIGMRGSFRTKESLRAVVTVPSLEAAAVHGSGDIDLAGWNAETMALAVMGSGDIRLDGAVDTVNANVNGSGDIDLRSATIRVANARVHGSGDIRLGSLDKLVARVSGSGDIDAADVRDLDQSVHGSGDIRVASAR